MKFENGEYRHVSIPKSIDRIEPFMRKAGTPCPFVIPRGHEVNNLKSWALYKADISSALEAFELALSIIDQEVSVEQTVPQSLIFAGITSYCKCYTSADGRSTKVNPKKVFKGDSELRSIHEKIKSIRNSYIAHGGISDFERVTVRVALDPESDSKACLTTYSFVARNPLSNINDLTQFIEAAKLTGNFIDSKVKVLYERIKENVDLEASKIYTVDNIGNDLLDGFKVPRSE